MRVGEDWGDGMLTIITGIGPEARGLSAKVKAENTFTLQPQAGVERDGRKS